MSFDFTEMYDVLEGGGTILYPTDTIWGVGCSALNEEAVKLVFDIKKRPIEKKFILLVSSIDMLKEYVEEIHPRLETLLSFHSRPLTIVYQNAKNLPDILLSEDGSIAIRLVYDEFCKNMIEGFGKPLVSSSANISGQPYPMNFGEISSEILEQVDYVVQAKRDFSGAKPSVVASVDSNGHFNFIRE